MIDSQSGKFRTTILVISLALIDLVGIAISFYFAYYIRTVYSSLFFKPFVDQGYTSMLPFILLTTLIIFALNGLYRIYGRMAVMEFRLITISLLAVHIIVAFIIFALGQIAAISRAFLFIELAVSIVLISSLRLFLMNRVSRRRRWRKPVVIIGDIADARPMIGILSDVRRLSYKAIQILSFSDFPPGEIADLNIPVKKYSIQACENLKQQGVTTALYVGTENLSNGTALEEINLVFDEVYIVLREFPVSSLWLDAYDFLGRPALRVRNQLTIPFNQAVKRILDVMMAGLMFLVLLPFFLLFSLLLRLDSKGPIIYTQFRLGKNGKKFQIYKFRTMYQNADEKILPQYLAQNPAAREEWDKYKKLNKDPRVTRMGRFLRKFSLDELPQLLNVLSGQMSFIGPRPYLEKEIDLDSPEMNKILLVPPGLTGWWQVMGRNKTTFEERLWLDKYYISNWSLWLDAYIVFKTVWVVLSGSGK